MFCGRSVSQRARNAASEHTRNAAVVATTDTKHINNIIQLGELTCSPHQPHLA